MDDESIEQYIKDLTEILPPPLKSMDIAEAMEILRNQDTLVNQLPDVVGGPYKVYLTMLTAASLMAYNAGMPADVHLAVASDMHKFCELLERLNEKYELPTCSEEIH